MDIAVMPPLPAKAKMISDLGATAARPAYAQWVAAAGHRSSRAA
jgi:hypothetical protein